MADIKHNGDILKITKSDQNRTVVEMFSRAKATSSYYTMLMLSAIIVTAGILLGNSAIIFGGVLVAPILTPVLVIGLGLSVGELTAISDVLKLILKSFILVVGISFILVLLIGNNQITPIFENTARTAILYFIVALASAMAATFAWARKEISEILPGVSLAVTLVPPLSLIGIGLGKGNVEIARFYLIILILNLLGIVIGSLIVFSLLKFEKIDRKVKTQAEELKK